MTAPGDMTDAQLRTALISALVAKQDEDVSVFARRAAQVRYDAIAAEINRREGVRLPARSRRLLRGF